MPVKFALLRAFSIINLLLITFVAAAIGYIVVDRDIPMRSSDWLSFILFLIAIVSYAGSNYCSLRLFTKYKLQDDIKETERITILVFFLCLLIFQTILAVYLFQMFPVILYNLKLSLRTRRYDTVLLQLLPVTIFLLTCYCQLLLFPFMKAIRKRHNSALNNLFGETNDAS